MVILNFNIMFYYMFYKFFQMYFPDTGEREITVGLPVPKTDVLEQSETTSNN